jgi:hypothetical protein
MLKRDGEDHLDRSCGKLRSVTSSQGGGEYCSTISRRKANWIGHKEMNCLLKRFVEGKIEGRIRVRGRRGTRREKLLDDFNEKRRYWTLKRKHWIAS